MDIGHSWIGAVLGLLYLSPGLLTVTPSGAHVDVKQWSYFVVLVTLCVSHWV